MDQGRGQERKRHAVQHHAGCLGELRCLDGSTDTVPNQGPERSITGVRTVQGTSLRGDQGDRQMRAHQAAVVFKVFTNPDPKSELTGRDMYEKMVQFKPQFLLFLASNNPPALVNDLANRERTNVVEHVSVFHDHPVEANHAQWKDIEATLETSEGKAEYFALFYAVFHQLLWQNPAGASALSHPNAWLSWKRRCMTPS